MKTLTVHTPPVAKARPRVTTAGGRARTFTPRTTEEAEWRIRTEWVAVHGDQAQVGPLSMTVTVHLAAPKSLPKRRVGLAMPISRPDADNFAKTALDALNGVAFADDSQVVDLTVSKRYAWSGSPRWEIAIAEASE